MHRYTRYPRTRISCGTITAILLLLLSFPVYGQDHLDSRVSPPLKPLVKMIGFVNATPAPTNVLPLLTFSLPGHKQRYTFLVSDMKVMAGPLRTAEGILAEVKPYTPNFRIRTSREIATQIAQTSPIEQVTILAEYARGDRVLTIQGFEKSSDGEGKQ